MQIDRDQEFWLTENAWIRSIRSHLDQCTDRSICIFVHGYNSGFVDNTLVAAELYSIAEASAVISFDWPSTSRLFGYAADKENATHSTRSFRSLLENLAESCDAYSISIVADSAGSPIVVNAMREIRISQSKVSPNEIQNKYCIERVVLAAPDMDPAEFTNGIRDHFQDIAAGVVVYATPDDCVLKFAETIYGEKRLGAAIRDLNHDDAIAVKAAPTIEWVDVSYLFENRRTRETIGHTYYHQDARVSRDILQFMRTETPDERGLGENPRRHFLAFP